MFDEDFLAELDETSEVFEKGQPAEREQQIDAQYERAYRGVEDPLGKDFAQWENEGVWPSE